MHKVPLNIDKIKDSLPHGAITDIAKRGNCSRTTVLKVFKGESENLDALKAVKDYLNDLKNTKAEIVKVVNDLTAPQPATN